MEKNIVEKLEERLHGMAREVIGNNERLSSEHKQRFSENPDALEEHAPDWHQWGIITHSIKFREMYETELAAHLEKWGWGVKDAVDSYLGEKIDGKPKSELIKIAMPLHDLGKFNKGMEDGKFNFDNHDKMSQEIILGLGLENYGLSEKQIEYIAKCAGNHYELGFLRSEAKKSDLGYTMAFSRSEEFRKAVESKIAEFNELKVEIGLLFLADSLAKTDVRIPAKTDDEIKMYSLAAEKELQDRNLNPKLMNAVKQVPVNIAAAKEYLKEVV